MRGPRHAHPVLRGHALASSAWVTTTSRAGAGRARRRADDRGEGVISAALVVLIMAAIAALMWGAFKSMWDSVEQDTRTKVEEVGQ
jgi:hypothetical protein